jgi:hypothetical protein
MCCSPWPAIFRHTITGTWEVEVENILHHVLWYQNSVGEELPLNSRDFEDAVTAELEGSTTMRRLLQSLGLNSDMVHQEVQWRQEGGAPRRLTKNGLVAGKGNCLIIPLSGKWESIKLLNTSDTPSLLKDVAKALTPPRPKLRSVQSAAVPAAAAPAGGMVFLKFGIYDIVIAERPSEISAVLHQIDERKRPEVNPAVFDIFEKWYGCPVALCCFNDLDSFESKPIAFAFEPLDPSRLMVYTLDAHDGKPPDPDALVKLDHTIFVSSHRIYAYAGGKIDYTNAIPDHLKPYLVKRVIGMDSFDTPMKNGDFIFDPQEVRAGNFKAWRTLPPGAVARSTWNEKVLKRDEPYEYA